MKLNDSTLEKIKIILDESFLTSAGFQMESYKAVKKGDNCILEITFKDNKDYTYKICCNVMLDTTRQFRGISKPGKYLEEEVCHGGLDLIIDKIRDWTEEIENRCVWKNGVNNEIEKLRTEFNRHLEEHVQDDNAHFTEEERKNIYSRLDQLIERIRALEKEQLITNAELEVMQKVIDDLKVASHSMKKKSWWRTAGNKILVAGSAIFASEAGQKLLTGVIDKYLP